MFIIKLSIYYIRVYRTCMKISQYINITRCVEQYENIKKIHK
jgi:hypothetical protein